MSTEQAPIQPTFYLKHPDGSYSVADPQPYVATKDLAVMLEFCKLIPREEIDPEGFYRALDKVQYMADLLNAKAKGGGPR